MLAVVAQKTRKNGLKLTLLAAGLLLSSCRAVGVSAPATEILPSEAVAILPAPVSASAIAIDPSGQHLAAVNPDSGSISLVEGLGQGTPRASSEVRVGADP